MGATADSKRRGFLRQAAAAGGLVALGAGGALARAAEQAAGGRGPAAPAEIGVSPAEDLMREHGVLRRVLLIYDESLRRLRNGSPVPSDALKKAASIIRDFIEKYHEKLEEDHIFPKFHDSKELAELASVLLAQHVAGRAVTERIIAGVAPQSLQQRAALARDLASFTRMDRPHAAREDTVLFPAMHAVFSPKEYDEMGDTFEDKEQELFGKNGFEGVVVQLAALEEALGIYKLEQFTPPAQGA